MAHFSRPADPEWWGDYSQGKSLYHGTSWPRAQQVLREGLVPWNHQEGEYHPSNYGNEFESDWLEPRPDHVYMANSPNTAREHAKNAKDPATGEPEHGVVLAIDPSYLDPKLINPDEDTHPQPHQEDWISTEHPYESLSPDHDPYDWLSRGQMAEDLGYGDDPEETAGSIGHHGLIAYRGTIPPEAISVKYVQPNRFINKPAPVVTPGQMAQPDTSGSFAINAKVSTWVDPLDELQQYMQGLGQPAESVAPSVHHDSELDFAAQPVISPLNVPSPYPPGHEPKPVTDGPGGLSAGPTQKSNLLAKIKGFFKRTDIEPGPRHSLNWSGFGRPGKGLYYNDTGQVMTWDVHGPDAAPHHLEMHQEFRPDIHGINERQFLQAGHIPFNISPFGLIDNSWNPDDGIPSNQVNAIHEADPRLKPGGVNDSYGFGHGRDIIDRLNGYSSKYAAEDELHYALEIPQHVKDKIKKWVDEQDWPEDTEFEDPDDYHITLLYSEDGHEDHGDSDWLYPTEGYDVKVVALDTFGKDAKKPVVLRIESDDPLLEHANDLLDAAENRGLGVSRFPGGYKPHLTLAYAFEKPAYARYPRLHFTTGPATVSEPRTAAVRGMGVPLHHIQPHVHYHPYTGLHCSCPWGQPADNKAKHPFYREAGSQNVRKVRNQNQRVFRDEYGQNYLKALDQLVEYHPDIEPMVPWIASRAKHGDIIHHPTRDELMFAPNLEDQLDTHRNNALRQHRQKILNEYSQFQDANNLPDDLIPGEGIHGYVQRTFPATYTQPKPHEIANASAIVPSAFHFRPVADQVVDWAQWNNARQHPQRRGVVFDNMPVTDLNNRVRQFKADLEEKRKKQRWLEDYRGLTPPIHTFDNGPHKGWTVNQLRNMEDCEAESEAMGHCIGQEGQPYRSNVHAGNIEAFSLRDPEGYPHATWHYNPSGSLAHLQGRSGAVPDDYRGLISAWAEKTGRPDEEVGEEQLEDLENEPCPDCGQHLDNDGDCEYCGYPHHCPHCGEHGYDDDEGCGHCGHGVHQCPHCGERDPDNREIDEYHACENCGYPHDSEIELPPPQSVLEYDQQYHPSLSDHLGLAQQEGNPGENTVINPGTPDWESVFQDAAGLHPRDQQHFFNTIHNNGHQADFENEVQQYLGHPNPETWHTEDENNLVTQWRHNQLQHFNPLTQQQETPIFDWGNGQYQTAQQRITPQLWKENYGPELDYSPSQQGGWNMPQASHTASDSDPYICDHCMQPKLSEPKPRPGDWRWSQTCINCGRTTSISPTHPIVQQIKKMQPQYPTLLNEVGKPRPLGDWMASTVDPKCPECGTGMQWRDAAGLGGLWPKGAWECTNQRCWHMIPPGELAPDTVPQEMTNDWQPEGWNSETTEHPLGPHTGSVRYSAVRSWTKGQWGKGLVDNDDIVHVWPSTPEHEQVPSLLDPDPQVNFLVNPAGGFLLQGGRQGREGWHQFIQDQVPELWPMPQLRTTPGTDLQDMGDDDSALRDSAVHAKLRTMSRYNVLNADGTPVAEYDELEHANESARENARAGNPANGDFYTVWDAVEQHEGQSWKAMGNGAAELMQ